MIFTVWSGKYVYLVEGEYEPLMPFDEPKLVKLHRIEADSEEDAKRQTHELMGWKPYVPMADALSI